MTTDRKNCGFTLVEIIVAVAFFALIAVGVGQALVAGQKASIELKKDSAVLTSCEDLMRQFSSMTISDLAPSTVSGTTIVATCSAQDWDRSAVERQKKTRPCS